MGAGLLTNATECYHQNLTDEGVSVLIIKKPDTGQYACDYSAGEVEMGRSSELLGKPS